MKPLIARSFLWAGVLALFAVLPVSAQTPPAAPAGASEVEVAGVKFSSLRYGQATWYEVEVDLIAKPATTGARFVNRVKIALSLATEPTPAVAGRSLDFYRSSVEAVGLEAGRSTVRFYLPPEVVKRDGIRGDAKFWLVELSVGGNALATNKKSVSDSISDKTKLEGFKSKITSEATVNDGILVPQYFSPYALDGTRASPAFIRIEGAR